MPILDFCILWTLDYFLFSLFCMRIPFLKVHFVCLFLFLSVNGTDQRSSVDEADIGVIKVQPQTVVAPAHATAVQPAPQPIPAPRKSAASTHSSTSTYSNAGLYLY